MEIEQFFGTSHKERGIDLNEQLETTRLSPIDLDLSGSEFSIWGVVTYVIHSL